MNTTEEQQLNGGVQVSASPGSGASLIHVPENVDGNANDTEFNFHAKTATTRIPLGKKSNAKIPFKASASSISSAKRSGYTHTASTKAVVTNRDMIAWPTKQLGGSLFQDPSTHGNNQSGSRLNSEIDSRMISANEGAFQGEAISGNGDYWSNVNAHTASDFSSPPLCKITESTTTITTMR